MCRSGYQQDSLLQDRSPSRQYGGQKSFQGFQDHNTGYGFKFHIFVVNTAYFV
jgi:hypothetical protein